MFGVPPLGGDSNPLRRRRLKAGLQTIALFPLCPLWLVFIPLGFRSALCFPESPTPASLHLRNRCRTTFLPTSDPSSFSVRDSPQIKLVALRSRAGPLALVSSPQGCSDDDRQNQPLALAACPTHQYHQLKESCPRGCRCDRVPQRRSSV